MMPESVPGWVSPRHYFKASGTRPRKRFGQNFLDQPPTAKRIVDSAQLDGSETVLEVGPGLGALTRHLLLLARHLVLVEMDRDLAAYLRERTDAASVEVVAEDILSVSFEDLAVRSGSPLVLLGNLPYHISSPLLFRVLESASVIERAVFMVQREVAERLVAEPGTRQYGILSVLLRAYADTRLLFRIGPGQFYPPPKVESAVLRIDFSRESGPGLPPFDRLRRLVKTAFSKRRKTLKNNLSQLSFDNPDLLTRAFERLRIDPQRRPETLTAAEFAALAEALEAVL